MACDTFIKIAQKCRRHFVLQQVGEVRPFIEEILDHMSRITSDLSSQQIHTFYEGVGCMIAAQTNAPVQQKLLAKMMENPNFVVLLLFSRGSGTVLCGRLTWILPAL